MLLVLNSHYDLVEFTLPPYPDGSQWKLLLDTNITDAEPAYVGKSGEVYGITGRSLVLYVRID